MQYSYEHWANESPEPEEKPIETPAAVEPRDPSFPFEKDLKELEESLSLDWEAGMEAYRQYQEARQAEDWSASESDEGWDDLARLVATQVMAHLQESPLQNELEKMRARMEQYHRDNRAMAEQVQRLTEENEHLRKSVSSCELEVACYRHLVGNLYLKL